MRLVILFHRLGPYHHARLKELAAHIPITAVEYSQVDNTYAWDTVRDSNGYSVISLFNDADIETKPIHVVRSYIISVLDRLRPQVVAIPGWSSPASLAALAWCSKSHTPAILMSDSTAHDEKRIRLKELIKSRVVRLFSTAVVGGVPHVDYVTALGLPKVRTFVGYDVVDNDYFAKKADNVRADAIAFRKQFGLPDRYFLASNRFIEKKNLPRLLDAYSAYAAQTGVAAWDMVLLGDGNMKTMLIDQVSRLGLIDQVQFPGFRQYDELPIFYALADAFIHSSTSEQWGLVVNEAMASGLPVLVSERCGCARDLVRNGVNGFSFNPYDINGITARMLQISGGDCNLASMGQASQQIIQGWSPATFAASLLKAAEVALAIPRRDAGLCDRTLLWGLMQR